MRLLKNSSPPLHIYELGKVNDYGGNYIIQNFSPWQFSVAWGENHPLYVPVRVKNLFWVKLFDIRTQNSLLMLASNHVKSFWMESIFNIFSILFCTFYQPKLILKFNQDPTPTLT